MVGSGDFVRPISMWGGGWPVECSRLLPELQGTLMRLSKGMFQGVARKLGRKLAVHSERSHRKTRCSKIGRTKCCMLLAGSLARSWP